MDIEFRIGSSKKSLGRINLLAAIICLSALAGGVLFFLTDGANIHALEEAILELVGADQSWFDRLPEHTLRLIILGTSLVTFMIAWWRILYGLAIVSWQWGAHLSVFAASQFLNKLGMEISTYPNTSGREFLDEIQRGIDDHETISEATTSGYIYNQSVSRFDWTEYPNDSELVTKLHSSIDLGSSQFKRSLEDAYVDLQSSVANWKRSNHEPINFYVSPVQPAPLYALNRIKKLLSLESSINLITSISTGPETVQIATSDQVRTRKAGNDRVSIFVAPLSAVCTAPYSNDENPTNYFKPVCGIVRERQDILIVDSESRTPVRRGILYYYDNSTAEELIANLFVELKDVFDLVPINEYKDYKRLLQGESLSSGVKLKPGDGIVTWPPLTSYYTDRGVTGGYLKKNGMEKDLFFESGVYLFASNQCFESGSNPNCDLAWKFMRALTLTLMEARATNHSVKSIYGLVERYLFSFNYGPLYHSLIR